MASYKGYDRIEIRGDQEYVNGVTACLDAIKALPDGRKLLERICGRVHFVTIQHTDRGNSCAAQATSASPVMTVALASKNETNFRSDLNVAIEKATGAGLTLEHFARQLFIGMTPASYDSAKNVVPPTMKNPPPKGASPQDAMLHAGLGTSDAISVLKDLMSGKRTVRDLPDGWDYDLPRLLRSYLTAGSGAASIVKFNHTKTFHCEDDPAMHQRPPAIGLAHEMMHALHNSTGANMRLVVKNNEKLEEVITTGMPPYNFEEISDNKMRTQWPSHLHLRHHY